MKKETDKYVIRAINELNNPNVSFDFYGDTYLNVLRFSKKYPTVLFGLSSDESITILNGKIKQDETT